MVLGKAVTRGRLRCCVVTDDVALRGSVELTGVSKRYGSLTAVDDITLSIASGEFVSLLGPSGCGKTTTLRLLAGFEQPNAGDIRISGASVAGVPPYARDVNTVFQNYALFPHMSVRANVAFGPQSRRVDKSSIPKLVDDVLRIVRLTELADRKPHQLSGGQQQRVALARALVNRPSALLLDEPLGALDLQLRKVMQFELKRIHEEVGITFILVTHDQEEALTMSDRIVVMNGGRVEQDGAPQEIYSRPATAFVAGFIGTASLWPGEICAHNKDDTLDVRLVNGTVVRATATETLEMATPVTVVMRPEHFTVSSSDPVLTGGPAGSSVQATVVQTAFQGASITASLDLGAGMVALAHIPVEQDHRGGLAMSAMTPGSVVWLAWSPRHALVVCGQNAPAPVL